MWTVRKNMKYVVYMVSTVKVSWLLVAVLIVIGIPLVSPVSILTDYTVWVD